jgi:hypothetical protein
MAENLDRFKKDLDRLLNKGHDLQFAFIISAYDEETGLQRLAEAGIDQVIIDKAIKEAKTFRTEYQKWYTECLSVIKQIIPDRLKEFRELYERPANRKQTDFLTYVISDAIIGLQTSIHGEVITDQTAALPKYQAQLAILSSAKARFSSSLFEIRQLVLADLFDSEIDSARHLLKNKFLRAAGAIAGVVLEKHLRQVCDDHNVKITKKNPSIGDLNELLKAASVIDVPQWRHISLLGDIRNICDHNKQQEPTEQQVADLLDGTDKVLKTIS